MNNLQQAYKSVRALSITLGRPMNAAAALNFARHSLARDYNPKDKNHYYRAALFGHTPAGKPFGGEFWPLGSSQMVWVEKPDAQGMRDCGNADEIIARCGRTRLDHTGWYIDNDQSQTAVGCVIRWGRYYVPAIRDPHSDGPIMLAWSDRAYCHTGKPGEGYGDSDNEELRDCARRADRLSELYAEQEREYDAASTAGGRWADAGREARQLRAKVRAVLRDLKSRPESDAGSPACGALLEWMRSRLAELEELREERAKLAAGDYESDYLPGWNTRDQKLVDVFCDAAGITVKQWGAI